MHTETDHPHTCLSPTTRPAADHMLNEDQCWQAVLERDRSQDGDFYFGVVTTGIFCRPSCAARRPLRRNVRFFRTTEEATRSGLRACLRCRPLATDGGDRVARVVSLCRFIREQSSSGDQLSLEVLAARGGISTSRLRRDFDEVVGVSPRAFVEACRFESLKEGLSNGDSVTRAIYDAGFSSSSRVYDQVDQRFGMPPGRYRAGAAGIEISYCIVATSIPSIRSILIAATDRGICSVQLGESNAALVAALAAEFPNASISESPATKDRKLEIWAGRLVSYLEGPPTMLDLPLDVSGTTFQQRVWKFIQTIPVGHTRSYSEVATAIGKPRASRAVARACAANRVALLIPCHRVIRADGTHGGYRWGSEQKETLLDIESKSSIR